MYYRSDHAAASDTKTNMCPAPHVAAIRLDASVPLDEITQCDLLVADDLAADDSFSDEMELLITLNHAWLCRLRRLNRTRSGCWTGTSSDYANADLHFSPHARTIVFDSRIPTHEIFKRDFLVAADLVTSHALGYSMEFVTIRCHAWLSGHWRRDTIANTGRSGYRSLGASRC
jgi:hypothetical protein